MERVASVLASLAAEPSAVPKLVLAIEDAVRRSFVGRHGLVVVPGRATRDEERRRINICLDAVEVLRGDLKWSWERVVDHLPECLSRRLDGLDWTPSERAAWTPPEREQP